MLRLAVSVIVILLAATFLKNQIVKSIVTIVARRATGARVTIDSLSFSIIKQQVRINNLKVYNPPGFSKGVLLPLKTVLVKILM